MQEQSAPAVRPPVALGCLAAAGGLALLLLFVVAGIKFLESGANSGKLVLDPAESYARGSVEFVGTRNVFIVRLADGTFIALSDLDAANRANAQRRCRVAPVASTDPRLSQALEQYGSRMSARAAGSTLLLREDCNGAIYDVAGTRLNGDGANLDRFPVEINEAGRLTVDVSKRVCTSREGSNVAQPEKCP